MTVSSKKYNHTENAANMAKILTNPYVCAHISQRVKGIKHVV